jgi:hypothetical protein
MNAVLGSARRAAKTMGRRDPLLTAARVALVLAMGLSAIVTVAFVVATPAVLVMNKSMMASLVSRGAPAEAIWAVVGVLAASGIVAGLGYLFFRHLYRIVASVEDGDPFIPVNARRLQAMGWIAVAVHVLGIPMAMTLKWLDQNGAHAGGGFEFSYFGLLLALVLFVIARVFREGTRLREELEGTV